VCFTEAHGFVFLPRVVSAGSFGAGLLPVVATVAAAGDKSDDLVCQTS
jgi:hypothetical protein